MTPLKITRLVGFGSKPTQTFNTSPVTLGTDPGSSVRFDPAWDKAVAPRHGSFRWSGRAWEYHDAGTPAGTFHGGARVAGPLAIDGTVELELGKGGPRIRVEAETEAGALAHVSPEPRVEPQQRGGLYPQEQFAAAPRSRHARTGLSPALVAVLLVLAVALTGGAVWFFANRGSKEPDYGYIGQAPSPSPKQPPSPPSATPDLPATGAPPATPPTVTHRLLVKWRTSPGSAQVRSFASTNFVASRRTYSIIGEGKLELVTAPGGTVEEAVARLERSGLVEYAEPDRQLYLAVLPNDPGVVRGLQWGLHNIGAPSGEAALLAPYLTSRPAWKKGTGAQGTPAVTASGGRLLKQSSSADTAPGIRSGDAVDIGSAEAWQIRNKADNVIVCVIDTGVRYTHEDLAPNMWRNPREIPGNGIDDDANGYVDDIHGINAITRTGEPIDDNGHGTHCAGIIGAAADNGTGISGVAWSVQIMACKFLDASGNGSTSDALACIEYAGRMGAHILSNSWGGGESSRALEEAIAHARKAGIVFVAAAGNESLDVDGEPVSPSCYTIDNMVVVGAIDRFGNSAAFSNYGREHVHLFAPGVAIFSTWADSDTAYRSLDGTSMATPFVSGALALVKANAQYHAGHRELIDRVLSSARPLPGLEGKCTTGAMLDLAAALAPPPPPPAEPAPPPAP